MGCCGSYESFKIELKSYPSPCANSTLGQIVYSYTKNSKIQIILPAFFCYYLEVISNLVGNLYVL